MELKNTPIIVALSDILPSDNIYDDITNMYGLKTRFEFWIWLESNYGAIRLKNTVMSQRFGYKSTGIEFPNRESYTRYCLAWL